MQICILIVAACVPLMLCVKPIYLILTMEHGHAKQVQVESEEDFQGGDYATSNNYLRASIIKQPETVLDI